MRKKSKMLLDNEISFLMTLETCGSDLFIPHCILVAGMVKFAFGLGYISPEEANSYLDVLKSLSDSLKGGSISV